MTVKLPQKAGFVPTVAEWDQLVRIAENLAAQLAQAQASAVETVRIVGAERDAARAEVARLTAENDFLNGGAVADKQGIDILLAENERLTAALAEADGALSGCNDEILELRAAMRQPAPAGGEARP